MGDRPEDHRHDEPAHAGDGVTGDPADASGVPTPPAPPVAGVVPPMQPSAVVGEAVPSAWPTVLGVLAIILGSLWILGGVWAIVAPIVLRGAFGDFMDQQITWYSIGGAWRLGLLSVAVLSLATAVLLLIGGIKLARRKPGAATLLAVWSIAMIVLTCANTGMQYALQDEYLKQIAAQTQGVPGGRTVIKTSMTIGLSCGALIGFSGPVFVLWWFRRRVIREEVATWA